MSVKDLLKKLIYFPVSPTVTRALFHVDSDRVPPGHSPRSILIIRLDVIGDVVLSSPFLRELRKNYTQAHITLVVAPEFKNLVELCPYCDDILTFDWRAPRFIAPFIRHIRAYFLARRQLWHRSFDLAIIPRWDVDSFHATILAYFSRARRRIAFSEIVNPRKSAENKGYDALLTDPIPSTVASHEVSLTLSLLSHMGGSVTSDKLELWLRDEDRRFALEQLPDDHARVTIAIAPGALYKNKQWPVERYKALANWAIHHLQARVVIVGGRTEKPLGYLIAKGLPKATCIDLTGKTTLRQTAAVLECCTLFVGNDTGAKHIAAAVGAKVVEISRFRKNGDPMHPQSPFRFHAWGVENIVLQPEHAIPPCDDFCKALEAHCILGVNLQTVQNAVTELIPTLRTSETPNFGIYPPIISLDERLKHPYPTD